MPNENECDFNDDDLEYDFHDNHNGIDFMSCHSIDDIIKYRQQCSDYQNDVSNSISDFISKTNINIPLGTISAVSTAFADIITNALGLGGKIAQVKVMKEIEIIREFEKVYHITLNSVLKYLTKHRLIQAEQQKQCFQFYENFCSDMTATEKIKFKFMENKFAMQKTAFKGGVILGGILLGSITFLQATKLKEDGATQRNRDSSKQYQKTERARLKYGYKNRK